MKSKRICFNSLMDQLCVRYTNGGTDVISSVKAEVLPIDDNSVPEDRIEVTVAFTASANTDFRKRAVEVSGNVIAENLYK